MRIIAFSKKNIKELLRDPLSYIFCLGVPVVMLILMSILNKTVPPNMNLFNIDYLCPGIVIFSFSFIMLFTALCVAKDRETSLLLRLYASPMKPMEYILGYTMPVVILALFQSILTFIVSFIIACITGVTFSILNSFLTIIILLPCSIVFIGLGILFGSLFNTRTAPGMASIIITVCGMLGGIWMDIDMIGGIFAKLCKILPFYQAVTLGRNALMGHYNHILVPFIIVIGYGAIIYIISTIIFKNQMKKDIN